MNEQMIPSGEHSPAPQPEKKPIIQSTKEFFENTFGSLKGKDVGQMVEQFSGEMTLVAEGLSEDQARLSDLIDRVSSEQTVFERDMHDDLHDLNVSIGELSARMDALESRLAKAEKTAADKKIKKTEGLTALLRQATWLAAILAGAWIVTTLINFFK